MKEKLRGGARVGAGRKPSLVDRVKVSVYLNRSDALAIPSPVAAFIREAVKEKLDRAEKI